MQGLADGYFVLPYTIGDYLANDIKTDRFQTESIEFDDAEKSSLKKREKKFLGNTKVNLLTIIIKNWAKSWE